MKSIHKLVTLVLLCFAMVVSTGFTNVQDVGKNVKDEVIVKSDVINPGSVATVEVKQSGLVYALNRQIALEKQIILKSVDTVKIDKEDCLGLNLTMLDNRQNIKLDKLYWYSHIFLRQDKLLDTSNYNKNIDRPGTALFPTVGYSKVRTQSNSQLATRNYQ